MELAQEGQLWMQRQRGSVCELDCPDWRGQWNHAGSFGSSVYTCKLACTVLVRLDCWSVWGAWVPSPVMGHFLGPPVWRWQMSREQWGRYLPSLLLKVYMYGWPVVQAEADFATSVFLFQGWWEGCSASGQRQEESWTASCVHLSPWDWVSPLPSLKILKARCESLS